MEEPQEPHLLTVPRGVGLIFASTIGSGVFVSTSFMIGRFSDFEIILAWILGTFIAGCGVLTYRIIGSQISRSGGEFEYLSAYVHPSVSCAVGYGTLLLGFVCPIAFDAMASAHFLFGTADPFEARILASVMVTTLFIVHGLNLRGSAIFQDLVSVLKYLVVMTVLGIGLYRLSNGILTTEPQPLNEPLSMPLATSPDGWLFQQYWIAYAFSGFNAVIYVAGRFKNPIKEVPRSLMLGFVVVAAVILGTNILLVLAAGDHGSLMAHTAGSELAHARRMIEQLLGPQYSQLCSFSLGVIFLAAMSACLLLAPNILSAMSRRGHWVTTATHGYNTVFVCLCALGAIWYASIRDMVVSFSSYMFLISALTAFTVLLKHAHAVASLKRAMIVGMYGVINLLFLAVGIYNSGPMRNTVLPLVALLLVWLVLRWYRSRGGTPMVRLS